MKMSRENLHLHVQACTSSGSVDSVSGRAENATDLRNALDFFIKKLKDLKHVLGYKYTSISLGDLLLN